MRIGPISNGRNGTSIVLLGSVANASQLPSTDNAVGDAYINDDDGNLYVWTGTAWNDGGQIVGPAGADGAPGANGADGTDALWNYLGAYNGGIIYTAGDVVTHNGKLWYRLVYTSAGYTPSEESEYWDLLADSGAAGSNGQGVPAEGTTGQVLSKVDSTDYNTQWTTNNLNNLSDVVVSTPLDNQLLVYDNATSLWVNANPIDSTGIAYKEGVPASPTSTGQVGQLAIDGVNAVLYVCTSTNNWQKVSLNAANFSNAGGFV